MLCDVMCSAYKLYSQPNIYPLDRMQVLRPIVCLVHNLKLAIDYLKCHLFFTNNQWSWNFWNKGSTLRC